MQAQKVRTKSALLIWTKSDLSDKVFNRYFTSWPRYGTGYFRSQCLYIRPAVCIASVSLCIRPDLVYFTYLSNYYTTDSS